SEEPGQDGMFAAFDWLATVPPEEFGRWCMCPCDFTAKNALALLESLLLSSGLRRCNGVGRVLDRHIPDDILSDCEDGLGWLTTLGPDTPAANAKTLRWILEWRLARPERELAKERKLLIAAIQKHATTQ